MGHRFPNVFVDHFSDDSPLEVRRVQEIATDLGSHDGVLIDPEGTRFSEANRRRVLERFHERNDAKMLEYVSSLPSVLPPRTGGTFGLLEAAAEADVVVCSHMRFEGAASLEQISNGKLRQRGACVEIRRISRDEIPSEREARMAWLREEWQQVDTWVVSNPSSR